ncbi:ABC transporter permease [Methanobrevibacter sp.]|uniref:ABC transporter permease n=1 Tax=Methanobrevibacter sp. TaxID=66852 RepID=UPI0038648CDA
MKFIDGNDLFLLEEVVRRNFSSKYKGSVLGIFWSVLKPLLIMIIFTIIFSTLFSRSIENFPVYFLSGRCIYDFFSGAVGVSMNSIHGNKRILSKTAAKKYIFILGSVVSEFLNFIISLGLLVVIMIATNSPFYFSVMPVAIVPILSEFVMVIGLALMLAILATYYTDVKHLWSVISLLFMYGSALFYPMEIVPQPYRQYMMLNPVFWLVDQFRCVIYKGVIPNGLNMVNSLLLSCIILVFGIIVYKKYENKVSMKF